MSFFRDKRTQINSKIARAVSPFERPVICPGHERQSAGSISCTSRENPVAGGIGLWKRRRGLCKDGACPANTNGARGNQRNSGSAQAASQGMSRPLPQDLLSVCRHHVRRLFAYRPPRPETAYAPDLLMKRDRQPSPSEMRAKCLLEHAVTADKD